MGSQDEEGGAAYISLSSGVRERENPCHNAVLARSLNLGFKVGTV